jgi:hypothetical protein
MMTPVFHDWIYGGYLSQIGLQVKQFNVKTKGE